MKAINIVLDEFNPNKPVFVEIEADDGRSINIGTRSLYDNGLTKIRITEDDIKKVV